MIETEMELREIAAELGPWPVFVSGQVLPVQLLLVFDTECSWCLCCMYPDKV